MSDRVKTWLAAGFVLLALAVPANLFLRTRLPPPPPRSARREASAWRSVLPDCTVFRDPRFALATVGCLFMEWGLLTPVTYLVSYAVAHGEEEGDAFLLMSYYNAASLVGRVVPGYVADRCGRFNTIVATIGLCVVTALGLWLPAAGSRPVVIAFVALFGAASGSNLVLIPVCLGQLCDSREFGRYYASGVMVASLGTLSGAPLAGALLDPGNDRAWQAVVLFCGLSYTVALICFVSARVLAVGWSPMAKF